jgi:hypothetical protein
MKGQMFLLAAIIIIASIIALGSELRLTGISVQRGNLEMRFESEIFSNVVNELKHALQYSYDSPENMTLNIFDFGNCTREKMAERSLKFKFLFSGIFVNISSNEMNVSVINLMNKPINVTLELNTSPPQTASKINLKDYGLWSTKFTSITSNTAYSLNISYEKSHNVTIEVRTKDVYVGFFDVNLESDIALHRNVFQESYEM